MEKTLDLQSGCFHYFSIGGGGGGEVPYISWKQMGVQELNQDPKCQQLRQMSMF